MSILLTILGIVFAVLVLVLIVAAFLRKDYAVTKEVVINRPVKEVFEYIRFVKNQDEYSVWNKIDPAMSKTYSGTDGEPGFLYAWDSANKKAGKGEQSIHRIVPGEAVEMDLHFIKPFEGTAKAVMTTTATGLNQTKVKWAISSTMKYPSNILLPLLNIEKAIGKDLEGGLANLKTLLDR